MLRPTQDQWQMPGTPVSLTEGLVHVWRARLDGIGYSDENLVEMLSVEERERAARFHFDQHRHRFVRSHAICRLILADYLDLSPGKIQFGTARNGKPFLLHAHSGVEFNLSHSGDLMALGVTLRGRIGVDVELISEKTEWRQIAGNYFNQRELTAIENAPNPREQTELFYYIWTLKEAYLKAIGDGIAGGLEQVAVQLDPHRAPGFLALPGGEDEKKRWQVFGFQPAAGACGAVVVEGRLVDRRIRYYSWSGLTDPPAG